MQQASVLLSCMLCICCALKVQTPLENGKEHVQRSQLIEILDPTADRSIGEKGTSITPTSLRSLATLFLGFNLPGQRARVRLSSDRHLQQSPASLMGFHDSKPVVRNGLKVLPAKLNITQRVVPTQLNFVSGLRKGVGKMQLSLTDARRRRGSAVEWDQSEFDASQNTMFLDVDDTIVASGNNFIAGIDSTDNQARRGIQEPEITERKGIYTGVLEFINVVSSGSFDSKNQSSTTGNLFVTTARPQHLGLKLVKLFQETLQQHQPDKLYREPLAFLWGNSIKGIKLVGTGTKAQARETLGTRPKPEKLKRRYEEVGTYKFETIKYQVLDVQATLPHYRRNSSYSDKLSSGGLMCFLGDNGQGDLYAGVKLLQEDLVDYVFMHDVRGLKDVPVEEWAERNPEACGIEEYRSISHKLRDRIVFFRNYEEATMMATSLGTADEK